MTTPAAERIWGNFCDRFHVVQECVPLFQASTDGAVRTRTIGRGTFARPVLARSNEMEAMTQREVTTLVEDWECGLHHLDGLLYCMGWKAQDQSIPLYIGKAESFGKGGSNLSANLQNILTDKTRFARWGDSYAYHVGDLSACVLPGHAPDKRTFKYSAWAQTLFVEAPVATPVLRQPVYFWAKAWNPAQVGIWEELGPTSLAFLEYLLIGVAGRVCSSLLNSEGVERRRDSGAQQS